MPQGTKVEKCYQDLKAEGKSKGSAAAICQVSTAQSLRTGKSLPKWRKRKAARAAARAAG